MANHPERTNVELVTVAQMTMLGLCNKNIDLSNMFIEMVACLKAGRLQAEACRWPNSMQSNALPGNAHSSIVKMTTFVLTVSHSLAVNSAA